MNLADMLSYADIKQLSSIATHYECDCSLNSKRELIQSILAAINKKGTHEQMIEGSSIEDLRFLNSLLFERKNSFSIEELVARAELTNFTSEQDDNWNPREVIAKFKQRGWLFNGYSTKTKYLFQVPRDLKKRFSHVLTDRFQRSIEIANEPMLYRDEQSLMQDDISRFLHFMLNQSMPLTTEGYMYKRHLLQVLDRLSVREELVQKEAWRFGYGRRFKGYPDRFSFIYDYCYYKGYIYEEQGIMGLTDTGHAQINSPQAEPMIQIYRYWLALYGKPIKNLPSFAYWISQLAQQWVTVTSLQHILCLFIKPFYYDSADTIFEKRILQMMMHQGLLKIGHDETVGYVTQVTQLGLDVIKAAGVMED